MNGNSIVDKKNDSAIGRLQNLQGFAFRVFSIVD